LIASWGLPDDPAAIRTEILGIKPRMTPMNETPDSAE